MLNELLQDKILPSGKVTGTFVQSEGQNGFPALTLWFTGLCSSGKTTLARAVYEGLLARGCKVELLDADVIRPRLWKGLGYSKADRDENIRRLGFLAGLLTRNGIITLVAAISPYREVRDEVRRDLGRFVEIYVNAPLEICERRDVKGLYRKARAGELKAFTGIDDPYEAPVDPDIECRTDLEALPDSADKVLQFVDELLV